MKASALALVIAVLGLVVWFLSRPADQGTGPSDVPVRQAAGAAEEDGGPGQLPDAPPEDARVEGANPGAPAAPTDADADREPEDTTSASPTGEGTLRGVVVDADGAPVGGAEVALWNSTGARGAPSSTTTSAPDGRFVLPGAGPRFVAAARSDTLGCLRGLRGEIDAETRCEGLELVVGPLLPIEGVVQDEDGRPIEGARLKLSTGLNSRGTHQSTPTPGITWFSRLGSAVRDTTETDARGRFRIEGEPAGPVQVRVEAAGFVGDWIRVDATGGPLTLTLSRGLVMRGTCFGPDGSPAQGVRVMFRPAPTNTGAHKNWTLTGPDGSFVLSGLDPEEEDAAFLVASLEWHAVELLEPPAFDRGGGEENVIRLTAAGQLSGVVTRGGEPAGDVRIALDGGGRIRSYDPFGRAVRSFETEAGVGIRTTGSDGRFAFEHRRPGPCTLHVWPQGPTKGSFAVPVPAGQESVTIDLEAEGARLATLRGRVVDARSGAPIGAVTVVPFRDGSGTNHPLETEDGRFTLDGLAPGELEVWIEAEGYARREIGPRTFAPGDHDLGLIELAPAVDADVLVVSPDGSPWESGSLELLDASMARVPFRTSVGGASRVQLRGDPVRLGAIPALPMTLRIAANDVEIDVPFDPSREDLSRVIRITAERPAPPVLSEFGVALVRADALDDPEQFVAELSAAFTGRDRAALDARIKTFAEAGPRRDLTITVNPGSVFRGTTSVTYDAAADLYRMQVQATTSSAGSASSGTSYSTEAPVPMFDAAAALRSNRVRILVEAEGEVLTDVEVDLGPPSEKRQPVFVIY